MFAFVVFDLAFQY